MKKLLTILITQLFITSILNANSLKNEWTRQVNNSANNIINYMTFDENNSFYLSSYTDYNPYLTKFSPDGHKVWSKKQNNPSTDILFKDQYIYSTGNKENIDINSNATQNTYISKATEDGKELWNTSFNVIDADKFNAISIDSKGSIYATGFTNGVNKILPYDPLTVVNGGFNPTQMRIIITKLNTDGDKEWILEYNNGEGFTISRSSGIDLILDENDNLYVIGNSTWNLPKNTHDTNGGVFISKYSTDGTHLWTRQYGHNRSASKILIKDNFIYAVGKNFLMKLNFDGNPIWTLGNKKLYSSDIENMVIDSSGNIIVSGSTYSSAAGNLNKGSMDVFISKISTDGKVLHNKLLGTTKADRTTSLGIDSKDNIYLLWESLGNIKGYINTDNSWHTFISKFTEDATEPLNLSNSSLTYKKRNDSLVSWQLISLVFPAYIKASELNVKQIYGWDFYDKEFFTPIELEAGKGYWVLPNSAETINFSKQTFYEKKELFTYMKKRYNIISKFNRWDLLGTPFSTTVEELKKEIGFKDIVTFEPVGYKFITNSDSIVKAGTGFWAK